MCVYTAHEKKTDAFDKRMTGGEKETKNEEERMREEKKTGIQNGRLLHRMQGEWLESERRPRASPRRVANTEYRPCVRSRQKKIEKKRWHPILREKKN